MDGWMDGLNMYVLKYVFKSDRHTEIQHRITHKVERQENNKNILLSV